MISSQAAAAIQAASAIDFCKETEPGFWHAVMISAIIELDQQEHLAAINVIKDGLLRAWRELPDKDLSESADEDEDEDEDKDEDKDEDEDDPWIAGPADPSAVLDGDARTAAWVPAILKFLSIQASYPADRLMSHLGDSLPHISWSEAESLFQNLEGNRLIKVHCESICQPGGPLARCYMITEKGRDEQKRMRS